MFTSSELRHEYFHGMIVEFNRRWPLRHDLFPSVPFPVVLDQHQQEEMSNKLEHLRRVRLTTFAWLSLLTVT